MKIITNLTDRPLPMPDGRTLPAKGRLRVPDHVALGERVRSWGLAVRVEDYIPPDPVEPETQSDLEPEAAKDAKPGRSRATDKAPETEIAKD